MNRDYLNDVIEKLGGTNTLPLDYVEANIDLAEEIIKEGGDYMDLDCMVSMSKALSRRVSYKEYSIVSRTELFDDMGLYNVNESWKDSLEKIIACELSETTHIVNLPKDFRYAIEKALEGQINEELDYSETEKDAFVDDGMNGRLCDLEDTIDWRSVLFDHMSMMAEKGKNIKGSVDIGYNLYDLVRNKGKEQASYEQDVLNAVIDNYVWEEGSISKEFDEALGKIGIDRDDAKDALAETFIDMPVEEQMKYLKVGSLSCAGFAQAKNAYFSVPFELELERFVQDYLPKLPVIEKDDMERED